MSPHNAVRGLRRAELITTSPETSVRFHRSLLDWLVLPAGEDFDCWVGERRCATIRTPQAGERPGWRLVFAGAAQDSFLAGPDETCAGMAKGRAQHGPWAPKPRRGEPCWIELFTDDETRADTFWTETLSWSVAQHPGRTTYSVQGRPVAERVARGQAGDHSGWLCYFIVEDLERAAEQVRELGGELLERAEHPVVGESLLIADAHGAVCALTGKTESWGG